VRSVIDLPGEMGEKLHIPETVGFDLDTSIFLDE
jgi:hypothetical protein